MSPLITLLFLALLLNCLSCTIVRFLKGGRLIAVFPPAAKPSAAKSSARNSLLSEPFAKPLTLETSPETPRIFLIAGLKSQPDKAYSRINFNGYDRVFLKFSLFGYNPIRAGSQLSQLMRPDDVACAVSLAAQVLEYSAASHTHGVILINPCSHSEIYQANRSRHPKLRRLSPLFVAITYLMGWVAVLPLLPANMGDRTSLALLMDQFFWMDYGNPPFRSTSKTGVIISTQDEMLDNTLAYKFYRGAHFVEIDTLHGHVAARQYAKAYEGAITKLLTKIQA